MLYRMILSYIILLCIENVLTISACVHPDAVFLNTIAGIVKNKKAKKKNKQNE